MAADIDPIRYGVLWQKVQDYERRFDDVEKRLNKMEAQLDQLIGLANQGKGGFWAGMVFVSAVSSVVGYFSHWFHKG